MRPSIQTCFALLLLCLSASKVALEPGTHPVDDRLSVSAQGSPASYGHSVVTGVEQKPNTRGKYGITHDVREALHGLRQAETDGHVKNFFGELDGTFHLGAAASQDDAGRNDFLEAAATELLAHETKQLLVTGLHDFGERLSRQAARGPIAYARHFDALIGVRELRQRAGVADLDVFRVLRRRPHRYRDVVGYLVTGDGNHSCVPDRAIRKY